MIAKTEHLLASQLYLFFRFLLRKEERTAGESPAVAFHRWASLVRQIIVFEQYNKQIQEMQDEWMGGFISCF